MSNRIERVLSSVLIVCAVVIAVSVATREFRNSDSRAGGSLSAVDSVKGWEKAIEVGITVGAKSARVKVVEFADLQCPACRRFHATISELLGEYPDDLAWVFVHYPLLGHPYALPAARAAECAERIGRFYPFVERVFAKQDSLGLKSWGSIALEAGIQDSSEISACASSTRVVSRIEAGTALGQSLQVPGTPTVIVNGWRFLAPTKENLVRAVEAVRSGKKISEIRAD